jgi:hypothetical protein
MWLAVTSRLRIWTTKERGIDMEKLRIEVFYFFDEKTGDLKEVTFKNGQKEVFGIEKVNGRFTIFADGLGVGAADTAQAAADSARKMIRVYCDTLGIKVEFKNYEI